ncbi:MAG: ComF family protein [Magnetococcales bacterium]|nr:ComF family protein [Magnetococcales bacterium]
MSVTINPKRLYGSWHTGFALDYHTISSELVGTNASGYKEFDTKRSPIGELLFQLKNRSNKAVANDIIDTVVAFLGHYPISCDVIIPVPPSKDRPFQPVLLLAQGIGKRINVQVADCVIRTRPNQQIKNVVDLHDRKKELEGLYALNACPVAGKHLLLFDDLMRSGVTLNAITDLLLRHGQAGRVDVLTITRTRKNQ